MLLEKVGLERLGHGASGEEVAGEVAVAGVVFVGVIPRQSRHPLGAQLASVNPVRKSLLMKRLRRRWLMQRPFSRRFKLASVHQRLWWLNFLLTRLGALWFIFDFVF
jgi:hypothetical protein